MDLGKFIGLLLLMAVQMADAQLAAQRGAMRLKEGQVDHQRPPDSFRPAAVPQPLDFGDQLQTAELSWAVVEFTDLSRIKVRELSVLEIVKPSALSARTGLKINRGAAYVSDLPRFREFQVQTPHGKVTPRGTEFAIEVRDNETRVVMFDGEADLENDAGRIIVRPGEQGTAQLGQAPRTARIEAKNLVQWWLYYPGVLDPDEIGFSAEEQARLANSLAAYRSGDLGDALESFPAPPQLGSDAEKIYYAALLLSVGSVEKATLNTIGTVSSTARALRLLISAVTQQPTNEVAPNSASELLALSY